MNIKQIKRALSTFRNTDVSIIKDDATRAKAQKLQAKQKGFTLLELLVVITLLATLSVGAMIAYEGIGENAKDVASAKNLNAAEKTIRTYRALEGAYPDQWDNLANADGDITDKGAMILLASETRDFFGQWKVTATTAPVWQAVAASLAAAGLEEFQSVTSTSTFATNYVPNLALNESYPLTTGTKGSELEMWDGAKAAFNDAAIADVAISIVPSAGESGTCTADAADLSKNFKDVATTTNGRLNLISDSLDDDSCTLVVAVGLGKDLPGSTSGSKAALSVAPTASTNNINPSTHYARYIGLFLVGAEDEDATGVSDDSVEVGDILPKARLVAIVDAEGNTIDQAIFGATKKQ